MFMPGADLNELRNMGSNPQEILDKLMQMHRSFREIETAGKPFVAAINGTAMGGGLELSLLCHHRIVIDDPKIKLGLPESKVGLLPGGGVPSSCLTCWAFKTPSSTCYRASRPGLRKPSKMGW
jgi:3-hydroxyacyl-CoA dehydrogenase/enoyl-CoA hydratase/3-hydroxybutyryl-CoA epimerase